MIATGNGCRGWRRRGELSRSPSTVRHDDPRSTLFKICSRLAADYFDDEGVALSLIGRSQRRREVSDIYPCHADCGPRQQHEEPAFPQRVLLLCLDCTDVDDRGPHEPSPTDRPTSVETATEEKEEGGGADPKNLVAKNSTPLLEDVPNLLSV